MTSLLHLLSHSSFIRCLLVSCAVICIGSQAYAQSTNTFLCEDQDALIEIKHPSHLQIMKVYDDIGYFGSSDLGLQIYDLHNPHTPSIIADLTQLKGITDIVMVGNIGYLALNDSLSIFDFTDPNLPVLLGVYNDQTVWRIAVDGSHVYGTARKEFMVFEVSDLTEPELIASTTATHSLSNLEIVAQHAVVCTLNGADLVDISVPDSPVIAGKLEADYTSYNLDVIGTNVFLACGSDGLYVFNIDEPLKPTLLSQYDTPEHNFDVSIGDDRAYLADHTGGVQILDITNLESPEIMGAYTVSEVPSTVQDLVVLPGNILYASEPGRIRVLNAEYPPRGLIHLIELPGVINKSELRNNHAYLAVRDYGLMIYDVSNPEMPVLLSVWNTPDEDPENLFILDGTLYLAVSNSLVILDITDLKNPQLLGNYTTDDLVLDVFVRDDLAYIANHDDGLLILDVSNPAMPVFLGQEGTAREALGIKVSGTYAYVAIGHSGFSIYEIGFPSAPLFLGPDIPADSECYDLDVRGNLVYVAGVGLSIYDMTNPALAVKLSEHRVGGRSYSIERIDDTVYIPGGDDGLRVMDVSNPYTPIEHGLFYSHDFPYGIAVEGSLALVGAHDTGLQLVDMNDYCQMCPLDYTHDGIFDVFDLFAFLDLFSNGSPQVDLDEDGLLDIFDIFAYLDAFNAGCP